MKYIGKKVFLAVCNFIGLLLLSTSAYCDAGYVYVSDMSKVDYQVVSGGKVYFRNLNSFDDSVTGCCYAFYLDTTTDFGKIAWSTILTKMTTQSDLYLYVSEKNPPKSGNPAQVEHLGNWK